VPKNDAFACESRSSDLNASGTPEGRGTPLNPMIDIDRRLHDSVAGRLLYAVTKTTDLHALLSTVAHEAVKIIPGCDSASITVIHDGAAATVATSDQRALAVDETQYADGNGPCLHAARTDRTVHVDDISTAEPWQAWRQTAREVGITASLSISLPTSANIVAALNLYTTRAAGWPADAAGVAHVLSTYASDTITLAYRLAGPFTDLHHIGRNQVPRQSP
jgi:GAF domain-containing protein